MTTQNHDPAMNLFSKNSPAFGSVTKAKPMITKEFCVQSSAKTLKVIMDVINAFANKDGHFTSGFRGDELHWYQLMGNLGSCASHQGIDETIQYIVYSDKILDGLTIKDQHEMEVLEKIVQKRWMQFKGEWILKTVWILTESDLWRYLQNRVERFPDPASVNLIKLIAHA